MYSPSLFLLDGTNWSGTFIFWATPLLLHNGITFTFLYFHFHLFLMHVSSTQWHSPLHHSSPLPLGERIWFPVSQITGSQLSANKDSFFSPVDIPRKRQQSEHHNLQNHLESSFQIRGCRLLELWIIMIMINHELLKCNKIIGQMMVILGKVCWAHFNYSCFMGMVCCNLIDLKSNAIRIIAPSVCCVSCQNETLTGRQFSILAASMITSSLGKKLKELKSQMFS